MDNVIKYNPYKRKSNHLYCKGSQTPEEVARAVLDSSCVELLKSQLDAALSLGWAGSSQQVPSCDFHIGNTLTVVLID